jgi:hypothetical protein
MIVRDTPLASVVVLVRDDATWLERVFDGLRNQNTSFTFEVVLVDSSTQIQPSLEGLGRLLPPAVDLTEVRSPTGLTPGAARNAGVAASRGRYICFLAADCIPQDGWLEQRVALHEGGAPAVAGAVGCGRPRTLAARVQWLTRFAGSLPGRRNRTGGVPLYGWSYRRELLVPGGFDEDLPMSEDSAFNQRLINRGVTAVFEPASIIEHIGLPSFRSLMTHQRSHGSAAALLADSPETEPLVAPYCRPGLPYWLPVARWLKTCALALRAGPATFLWHLALTPWSLAAHFAWATAFASQRNNRGH